MNRRTDDDSPGNEKRGNAGDERMQLGAGKGGTVDSSPSDPPDERSGTASPDGPRHDVRESRGAASGADAAAAAEPGRGQVRGADPRVDVSSADSRPAPDDTTTGSDRDTLKPGV